VLKKRVFKDQAKFLGVYKKHEVKIFAFRKNKKILLSFSFVIATKETKRLGKTKLHPTSIKTTELYDNRV